MAEIPMHGAVGLRPQRDSDAPFVAALYNTTRDDLRQAVAPQALIEELIEMQFRAQREGYGQKFPNAMYFIVETQGENIGRVAVDFGSNEVRIIDLALMPAARNKGHGTSVFRALQVAAGKVRAPLTLSVSLNNPRAIQLYGMLGFRVEQLTETHAFMVWYPQGG